MAKPDALSCLERTFLDAPCQKRLVENAKQEDIFEMIKSTGLLLISQDEKLASTTSNFDVKPESVRANVLLLSWVFQTFANCILNQISKANLDARTIITHCKVGLHEGTGHDETTSPCVQKINVS